MWSEIAGLNGRLHYRRYDQGHWIPAKHIQTKTSSDLAASAITDRNGDVWLVWSGTDETDDDIYFIRWQSGEWTQPARVNTDDEKPDILPQLVLNNKGLPQVTWSGFDGERYVTFASDWSGSSWSVEYKFESITSELPKGDIQDSVDPSVLLPEFVSDFSQACLHTRHNTEVKTFRIQKPGQ